MKKIQWIIIGILMMLAIVILNTQVIAADSNGNMVIVLDPGHGGGDPGASNSTYGLQEAKVNYQIAIYAKAELEKYKGVKVYLTRYANCPTIKERADFAKMYNADLVVSLHINSGSTSSRGAEIWVTQDKTKNEYYQRSKEIGEKILNKLQGLGINNRGVSTRSGKNNEWYPSGVVKDYYGIIRYSMDYGIRSILVEHCYISNNQDCEFINTNAKLKNIGIADATGIAEAYNLKKCTDVELKGIKLNKSNISLEIDEKQKLIVEYNPSNATNKQVTWKSSNPDIVRVWKGEIRGLKSGTAVITATSQDGKKTASCTVTVTGNGQAIPFVDVSKSDWYYDAVKYTYEKKIITGFTNTHFMPLENLTRGQLVTIIWRLENKPNTELLKNKFTDVENSQYYTEAIKWAESKKIVTGYGGTLLFGPNDLITRQDLALILNRYDKYKGKNNEITTDLTDFKDYKSVSQYAEDAVKWAVANKIILGNNTKEGYKTIEPHSNATRAEAATMLMRYIK